MGEMENHDLVFDRVMLLGSSLEQGDKWDKHFFESSSKSWVVGIRG
jgi:hypothetical protein